MDLATRRAIKELEGYIPDSLDEYTDPTTDKYGCMVERIAKRLNLTSLKFQNIDDMLDSIGLPRDKICTYCWNGKE